MASLKEKERTGFDLEQAIAGWKRSLRGLQAAQDGDLAELEGYLRDKIDPVIYLPLPGSYFNRGYLLSLRIDGRAVGPAISAVTQNWRELFPGQPLEYAFLDDEFDSQYDEDERFGQVFGLSSLLPS